MQKNKNRPGYKNTKVGWIPEGWESSPIQALCHVTSSKRILQSEYTPKGIPFFRSKEIIDMLKGQYSGAACYISEERFGELRGKFGAPVAGDILVSAVGTLGLPFLIPDGLEFYFKDGNLLWLRQFRQEVNRPFLFQFWCFRVCGGILHWLI